MGTDGGGRHVGGEEGQQEALTNRARSMMMRAVRRQVVAFACLLACSLVGTRTASRRLGLQWVEEDGIWLKPSGKRWRMRPFRIHLSAEPDCSSQAQAQKQKQDCKS